MYFIARPIYILQHIILFKCSANCRFHSVKLSFTKRNSTTENCIGGHALRSIVFFIKKSQIKKKNTFENAVS